MDCDTITEVLCCDALVRYIVIHILSFVQYKWIEDVFDTTEIMAEK